MSNHPIQRGRLLGSVRSQLPRPRGPLSTWCLERIAHNTDAPHPGVAGIDPLGADAQLALYLSYEVHYADPVFTWFDEWDPLLTELRVALEHSTELRLASMLPDRPAVANDPTRPASERLLALIEADSSPSLSRAALRADLGQLREMVRQRSLYHLREADQHMMAVSRLSGAAKQLFVEIQAGEYGVDRPGFRMHSDLYALTMRELDLDDSVNFYLDEANAESLLLCNLISLFTFNRRWAAAAVGHLASFECTSVEPMQRYVDAFAAAGASQDARRFYAVHILADAHHETVAVKLVDALAARQPERVDQLLFGVECALLVEAMFARAVLDGWSRS
ncbi:MAG: iron-containing redox enzyme family protein [Actinobacteria bacterium]|nr:iron-containing redox enzyme family protein [Actinomycetota bacterium]